MASKSPKEATPAEPVADDPQPGADSDGFGGDAPTPADPPELPPGADVIVSQPTEDAPAEPLPEAEPVADLTATSPDRDVVLRHHWTDSEGESHAPDTRLTVDAFTAEQLVGSRYATYADEPEGEPAEGDTPQ